MPKLVGTRKDKAKNLMKLLEQGPAIYCRDSSPEEFTRAYRVWAESWIIPAVKELVPELRNKTAL